MSHTHRVPTPGPRFPAAVLLGLLLLALSPFEASCFVCGTDEGGSRASNIDPLKATRALICFVKFQDDTTANANGCYASYWPVSLGTAVPAWSDSLLSPDSTASANYLPPSVSDYFNTVSRQNHWVYGGVLNDLPGSGLNGQCYIVPYEMEDPALESEFARVNREILDTLVARMDDSVNFADYDLNPRDGVVDQIWMFYRDYQLDFINTFGAGAIAELVDAPIQTADSVEIGGVPVPVMITRDSGITLHPFSRQAAIFITAHEHGHYLWGLFGSSLHLWNTGRFSLMGQCTGLASTPNIFERQKVGWIAPTVRTTDTLHFPLPNAIASGAGLRLPVRDSTEYFLVENRVKWGQNASIYELPDSCGVLAEFHELPGSGVLVLHHDAGGLNCAYDCNDRQSAPFCRAHKYLDVEWASGMFDTLGSGAIDPTRPDPIAGRDSLDQGESEGKPGTFFAEDQTMSIFTPYSDPSSNGYRYVMSNDWQQSAPTGINLLRISPVQDQAALDVVFSDTSKAFHVGADVDTTIWRGIVKLTADVTVDNAAYLRIEDASGSLSTEVQFRPDYDSQAGGWDAAKSELIVDSGGRLSVQGTTSQPVAFTSTAAPPDTADWYGIRVMGGDADFTHADIAYGVWGIYAQRGLTIDTTTVHRNWVTGIYITSSADTVQIRDSEIFRNEWSGICLEQAKYGAGMRNVLLRNKVYENGLPNAGYDLELHEGYRTGNMTDVLQLNTFGHLSGQGRHGILSTGRATAYGWDLAHQTLLYRDSLQNYGQDALTFSDIDLGSVRRCWIGRAERALAVSDGAAARAESTKFEGTNGTHVWNEAGSETSLGSPGGSQGYRGYNAFYRVLNSDSIMITNGDTDSLRAENNWWDYANCSAFNPPPLNRFAGPVDRNPWLCNAPALTRRAGDSYLGSDSAACAALRLTVLPNPAGVAATIRYEIPGQRGAFSEVEMAVYDVSGRRIDRPVARRQEAGAYELRWCGLTADGSRVPDGVYFVRLTADGEVKTSKVILLR